MKRNAAKDLLAALEYAVKDMESARDWWRAKSPNTTNTEVLSVSIGMARAAIAKAKSPPAPSGATLKG